MSKTDREIIWEILEFKKGLKWVTIPDVIDTLQAAREDEKARLREVVEQHIILAEDASEDKIAWELKQLLSELK